MAPINKRSTSYLCGQTSSLAGALRDWEHHPSLMAGVEALDAYQTWVSAVVLPIAFQWIEDHYEEVYGIIRTKYGDDYDKYKDDVGVVIAAAFGLVRQTKAYQDGLEELKRYKEERKNGTLNPENLNRIWTKITKAVRKETEEIFEAEEEFLDGTI